MMEETLPLVSVAIITYNQKKYLIECIESILEQSYPNYEIVVADDCSSDGTSQILADYSKSYPGRFVIKLAEKNLGITLNSNVAINSCRGKYIAMLGGDDRCLPGKLEKQVAFLEANLSFSLCGSYTKIIDENGLFVGNKVDVLQKKEPIYTLREMIQFRNGVIPVSSYMFRSESIPSTGFDTRLRVASDGLFFFGVASRGDVYIYPEFLTCYRVHQEQVSKKKKWFDDALVALTLTSLLYPDCWQEVRSGFQHVYKKAAVESLLNKEPKERVLGFFMMALRNKFSLAIFFAWMLVKFNFERFLNFLISRQRQKLMEQK